MVKTAQVEGVGGKLNFIMEHNKSKGASATEQWNATTAIWDLPTYILVDIFSRVPRTTMISMKCVCKTWYNLISDPNFGNTYFTTQRTVSLALSDKNSIWSLLELKQIAITTLDLSVRRFLEQQLIFQIIEGSCNGLICLSMISNSKQNCTLHIFNLQLKECATLPQPQMEKRTREDVYGFGFSPATGHYEVLRILTRKWQPGKSEAQVHTIGIDNGWRTIGKNCTLTMAKKWPDHLKKA